MAVTRIEEGGLGTDSFNLPVTLNGSDGSSTDAGDNIVLDASASGVDAGERLLYEGIPPDFANISTDTSVLDGATLTVNDNGAISVASGASVTIDSGATITNNGTATGFGSTSGTYDLNGEKLELDADADTSLIASTDDTIDIEIAGTAEMVKLAHGIYTFKGTDTGAAQDPQLILQRDSSSPADGDICGNLIYKADNDAGEVTIFGHIFSRIEDASNGTEDGSIRMSTMYNGTLTDWLELKEHGYLSLKGHIIASPGGAFTDDPLATIHAKTTDVGGSNAGAALGANLDELCLENYGHCGMTMISRDDYACQIAFTDESGHAGGAGIIYFENNANELRFYTDDANDGATIHFKIANDGTLTATDTSIGSISDERLKKNIADYTYDLETFKKFKPKTFDWKNPGQHGNKSGVRGFVAQDLLLVDPYWCSTTDVDEEINKPESVNPDIALVDEALNIGGVAVDAGHQYTSHLGKKDSMYISVINQLIAKIETLETKVAALESA